MKNSSRSHRSQNYRAVILDMDGTLLDSNAAHVHAWVEALRQHGHEVSEEEIWPWIGMGADNLLPAAVRISKESPEGKAITETRGRSSSRATSPTSAPSRQVRPLLERIKADGRELVVATSSAEEEVEKAIELVGVGDLLAGATSGSDGRSKPDPDVVQAALDRLKMEPSEVVMLGDTPYDIQAAAKVGIAVIAFRCGGFKDEDLKGALAIYGGAADLLANYADSPLGGGVRGGA